jgi:hypothetical protein
MDELNFNIYALARPSTPAEYSALLDEALSLLDELGEHIAKLDADGDDACL